ncbi:hypothetical protein [Nocardia sp. R7R-8]|uniref:hypothetical protein n=1 Tax=Nocardia sp. R7R-8 TaxID=3459304 RepID=UPI00403E3216
MAAAQLLLTQMGISPADLVTPDTRMPTFEEVIPQVRARLSEGTLRTYKTQFEHLLAHWAQRRLEEPTKADFEEMAAGIQANTRLNRTSRGETSAVEHFISTTRCVYRYAEDTGWIRPVDNYRGSRPRHCMVLPTMGSVSWIGMSWLGQSVHVLASDVMAARELVFPSIGPTTATRRLCPWSAALVPSPHTPDRVAPSGVRKRMPIR